MGCRCFLHFFWRILLAPVVVLLVIAACASSQKVDNLPAQDETLARYNRSARQAFEKGSFQQAAALYRKALDRAYVRDDFNAIVDAYYNLAICLINQRAYEEAFSVIQEAKTELALKNHGSQSDILLLEATVLQIRGDTDEALEITDQILAAKPETSSLIKSKIHYLRGVIAAQQGDTDRLREALVSLGEPELAQLRADRYELVGHLANAEQSWEGAVNAFDRAAAFRQEDLDYRKMASTLALSAGACEQAGKLREASHRYLRAGISAALQGDYREAHEWLDRAETLAEAAGDELAAGQARSYRARLLSN